MLPAKDSPANYIYIYIYNWIWHQVTHDGWYAIKIKRQPTNQSILKSFECVQTNEQY